MTFHGTHGKALIFPSCSLSRWLTDTYPISLFPVLAALSLLSRLLWPRLTHATSSPAGLLVKLQTSSLLASSNVSLPTHTAAWHECSLLSSLNTLCVCVAYLFCLLLVSPQPECELCEDRNICLGLGSHSINITS